MNYFVSVESPIYNKITIRPNYDKWPEMSTSGSFAVLAARVLGFDYADYLLFCREAFGAEIIGKGHLYPIPYFTQEPTRLLKLLNDRTEIIMKEISK